MLGYILAIFGLVRINLSITPSNMKDLEINCVGKCTVHTVRGKDITLKAELPDSIKHLFGLKKEDDKTVCGIVENELDITRKHLKGIFKGLSDSIHVDIGIPEKISFKEVDLNLGATRGTVELKKYKIKHLVINMGAGKAEIKFLKKNKAKNGYLEINTGAGTVNLLSCENFRADTIKMNIGAANAMVDFNRKPYITPSHLFISQAVSSSTILIPKNTTCAVEQEGILNLKSFDACNDTEHPDIIIHLDGALSSINVVKKR